MKKLILYIISKIYSKCIIANLWLLSRYKNKNFFYNHSLGFGDSFDYYLDNYWKITKSKKNLPLSFGGFNQETINFFFKRYKKLFFYIPRFFPYYSIISEVKKSQYFKPTISYALDNDNMMKNEFMGNRNKKSKKIIIEKLKNYNIKTSIKSLCKKKYICLFVKHYNSNINDISNGSIIRQTTNFTKIVRIIKFLKKKHIHTIVIGDKKDKGTFILKNKVKKVDFLMDYNPNFSDQIYVANNSLGYIGSSGGIYFPYFYLKKKIICFDTWEIPTCKISKQFSNLLNLYKRITIKNFTTRLNIKHLNPPKTLKYKITETSFLEIRSGIENFLLI
tara:strand:- start:136 stop:1134 length:999 start_codon:yes stop_codon:yes gene_type:complete